MISDDIWSSPGFDLPPAASFVGPFPRRDWLHAWWRSRGSGELLLAEASTGLVPLTLIDDLLQFAGEADLTDYHSPLGSGAAIALAELIAALPDGVQIEFDSLPAEAADVVIEALKSIDVIPVIDQHAVTAVLNLPESFDDYLMFIGKKDRHELRRKRRRFENELGPATIERRSGRAAVAVFADLHRRSAGDKGEFMTADTEEFFAEQHASAGAVMDFLVDGSGQPAAAVFAFEDDAGYYLYNSAFEPDARRLSPGNVILSHLIEASIGKGRTVFDFLKGDEQYKFRLGASRRPLFRISARTGGLR